MTVGGDAAGLAAQVGCQPRVLVVDDEVRILDVVMRALSLEGIAAEGVTDGLRAVAMATTRSYDLMILDLLMPGQDGLTTLEQVMARKPDLAVIVLSCLTDPRSKVRSLNLGADDYLAKPFHVSELLARVQARLRAASRPVTTTMVGGGLRLDLVRHEAQVGSRPVALTEREFQLLWELLRSPGRVVSKRELLAHVWGYEADYASNVVDVCVRRLRSRLGGDLITTVRGEGYRVGSA